MIKNLDEMEALLKMCRKQGVTGIKFEGVEISFGDLQRQRQKRADEEQPADFPNDGLTPEQLAFYSVGNPEQ